jgi:sterile alpha motif and leucine zipper-containing kinase AZK
MAPEVLRSEHADEKSDVYSFGVLFWELMTMKLPWTGMNALEIMMARSHRDESLHIPEDLHPDLAKIMADCFAQ